MYRYLHFDVFTDRAFEGNQLAVFPEPQQLDTAHMQRIAKEMAFSESTFIFPREGSGDVRMRIFTPDRELPMAGHPTIGSTFALALEGVIAPGRKQFVFELGVGPTPVSLEWRGSTLVFAWMTQPNPTFGGVHSDRAALAAACGISANDLVEDLPAQIVSCGVPYLLLALGTRAAVDAVTVDLKAYKRCCESAGVEDAPLFLFTTEQTKSGNETVYSRMLAPGFGIVEDPATGSASGPLGAYLVHYAVVSPAGGQQMVSLQGVAMGRPSRIHISIDANGREITRVRVGGTSVLVGRGELI